MNYKFLERKELTPSEINERLVVNLIKNQPNCFVEFYAKKLNKPVELVAQIMEKKGFKPVFNTKKGDTPTTYKDMIMSIFFNKSGVTAKEISEKVGCNVRYVRRVVYDNGYNFTSNRLDEKAKRRNVDKFYIKGNLGIKTQRQIASDLGKSKMYVHILLREMKADGEL